MPAQVCSVDLSKVYLCLLKIDFIFMTAQVHNTHCYTAYLRQNWG
jgi:hypothetical protein